MIAPAGGGIDAAVLRTRLIAAALVAGPIPVVVAGWFLSPLTDGLGSFAIAFGAIGLIAPAAGYHLFLSGKSRLDASGPSEDAERIKQYEQSFLFALSLSEGGALLGCVAWLLTGLTPTLIGVATHILVVGALWPSRGLVEWFIRPEPPR